ncbi:MAG: pantoate--beta-alanine ligase [Phycisphaerae bacterium]|nr:pantoate--beta-alanine ligase [Phycisphaerae bacterium]NUQ46935.1 pantoate--beta-alanine ligase [Phycisphaerae bacterium]
MEVASHIQEIRTRAAAARHVGRSIGFVPTMGALHAGHTSLIDASRKDGRFTVVSIFVNPTQFAPGEDFAGYPRTTEADLNICREHGVDLVFTPSADELYPPGDQTRVRVGPLAETLCGPFRPGHFEGVCTVVARLFHIVQPDVAYFGQKDAQQAVIIRRMVRDLCMPLTIDVRPIVREPDGLAMSSRNAYLSPDERRQAAGVYAALCAGRDLIRAGERRAGKIVTEMRRVLARAGPCTVDYLSVVDPETLTDKTEATAPVMLAAAVRIGKTRLIDNLIVNEG